MKLVRSITATLVFLIACASEPADSAPSTVKPEADPSPPVGLEEAVPTVAAVEQTIAVATAPKTEPTSQLKVRKVEAMPAAVAVEQVVATATPPEAQPAPQAQASLTRVDPSLVCMVNNHFMGKAQIPVVVEGRTYFGCCEMCKGRLAKDPGSRAAKDPVSGATVDKAVAVIAKDESGEVVYFENEANLQRYASR